jgi:hypothetical protein
MKNKHLLWIVLVLLLSPEALAEDPNSLKEGGGAPNAPKEYHGSIDGDVNFGQIGEDWYSTINLGFSMDLDKIGFGVQLPLRLCLIDGKPKNNNIGGVLRREDWDEISDYFRIIRFFRYGHNGEPIFAQVGDLPGATLGHGSIVGRYYNNTDIDHYKLGLQLDINTIYGGVETLFNNFFLSNIIGARGYLKPWSLVDTESYLNNLTLGFSVIADVTAPYQLDNINKISNGSPRVSDQKPTVAIGADIEFRVLNNDLLTLTPYMDFNGIVNAGVGFHIGISNTFHFPDVILDLLIKVEYRFFQGDYIPTYFDTFYEIQKYAYPIRDETSHNEVFLPKRAVLDLMPDKFFNGYYVELVFSFTNLFTVGVSYDDYEGPYNSNLSIYLSVPAFSVFKFGAYYYKHSFEGASQAFTFDNKSLFLLEAKYQIAPYLYLLGQFWRIWGLDKDPTSRSYGNFISINDWSLGVGFCYNF